MINDATVSNDNNYINIIISIRSINNVTETN